MSYFWSNVEKVASYQHIKKYGKKHGWIRELSKTLKISELVLAKKIRRNSIPNADYAVRIAQVLGTTVEALVQPPRQSSRDKNTDADESSDSYNQTDNNSA